MKNKVFEYMRDNDDDDGGVFEAKFQLPDDGCPNSEQFLRVRVTTHRDDPTEIELHCVSQHSERSVAAAETTDLDAVARMLYGTARLQTVKYIQPT